MKTFDQWWADSSTDGKGGDKEVSRIAYNAALRSAADCCVSGPRCGFWAGPYVSMAMAALRYVAGDILNLVTESDHMKTFLPGQAAQSPSNTGHGHIFQRPDGARARCGGPASCSECAADDARKKAWGGK